VKLQTGQTILGGKYRIERLLGRGAFGEVYLATHLELNVPRAVKVLHRDTPGVGSTEFGHYRGRFQLEAALGAHLDHPHIVRVYDFEEADGALYLVMAYCPGGSLKDRLARDQEARQRMPVEEAVRIAADVAHGLAAIHALEAVHRDLKPSNILFDADGRALVGDLGLAQTPGSSSRPTLAGSSWPTLPGSEDVSPHPGTLDYMSPEQEHGRARLRPPSDVYALGAVLFEMLTGKLYNNLRPGTRARSLRPDVPKWLDDLLARMLAAKPEDRPWDGAEAARLLEEGSRKKRVPWWPIAVAAAVVGLAAVWLLLRPFPPPEPPAVATPPISVTSLSAPTVAPSATWTVRPEPTQAPAPAMATATSLPTGAVRPTESPAPTATLPVSPTTPVPSPTLVPTAAPRPTTAPTTAPAATLARLLPAPVLDDPPHEASFSGTIADIQLAWRNVKPTLANDEYYLVTIDYKHDGQVWTDYVWTKQTRWAVKEHLYLLDLANDGRFTWTVRLMRAASVPGDGKPTGAEVPLSATSEPRVFVWKRSPEKTVPYPPPSP